MDQIYCKGPASKLDKKINNLVLSTSFDCITTGEAQTKFSLLSLRLWPFKLTGVVFFFFPSEFASYQSLDFKTLSVEAFSFGNDQYVVFAQPFNGKCTFLEWDHVEMVFRKYDEINSK